MKNVIRKIVNTFNIISLLVSGLLMVIGYLHELLGDGGFSRCLERIGLSWDLGEFQLFSLIFLVIWFLMLYVENKFL